MASSTNACFLEQQSQVRRYGVFALLRLIKRLWHIRLVGDLHRLVHCGLSTTVELQA